VIAHQAEPIKRRDRLGRVVEKCARCTRRVHLRTVAGNRDGRRVWVHSPARRRLSTSHLHRADCPQRVDPRDRDPLVIALCTCGAADADASIGQRL
jgi:hypothetical protein